MSKGKPSEDHAGRRDPFAERSLAEKSDAMARAYTAGRESRARGDSRGRRSSPEAATDGRDAARAVRKDRKGFDEESGSGSRRPDGKRRARNEGDGSSRDKVKGMDARRRSGPRSDRDSGPRRAEPLQQAPAPAAQQNARTNEGSHRDLLALEVDDFLRELKQGWRNASNADRTTWTASILMMVGALLPWVSDPAHSFQLGIASGGFLHLCIALFACYLVWRGTPASIRRRGGLSPRERTKLHRRSSLWLVLLGALSTLLGIYFVVLWGLQKDADSNWWVELHFGLYWTLAAGTGLSYGGYRRFAKRPLT